MTGPIQILIPETVLKWILSHFQGHIQTNAKIASQSSLDLETISKKQTLIDMYPNVVLTQGQKSACHFVNGST